MSFGTAVVIFALFMVFVVVIMLAWKSIFGKFWHWLNGHREYYHICGGGLRKERRPLRLLPSEVNWKDDAIVVKHMPFFRRAEVYGKARDFWSVEIRKDVSGQLSQAEPYVILKSGVAVWSIQEALEFLGKYPSLQAMLDRIAELEQNEKHRRAGLEALWRVSCGHRRTRTTQEVIRRFQTLAHVRSNPKPSEADVETWMQALRWKPKNVSASASV